MSQTLNSFASLSAVSKALKGGIKIVLTEMQSTSQ